MKTDCNDKVRLNFQARHYRIPGSGHTAYVDAVLSLLTLDSDVDDLLTLLGHWFDNTVYFPQTGEIVHDIALRHGENTQSESKLIATLMRNYLKPEANVHHRAWTGKRRRRHCTLSGIMEPETGVGYEVSTPYSATRNICVSCLRLSVNPGRALPPP